MKISPFFRSLRSSYQAELDDMAFDSEGRNILQKRLTQRRKEIAFLLQMMQLSPEMVAVVFHQGFEIKSHAAMQQLLAYAAEDLPGWGSVQHAVMLAPWAQPLGELVLRERAGDWFMCVAAALEYMHHQHDASNPPAKQQEERDTDSEGVKSSDDDMRNEAGADRGEAASDGGAHEEAGADWLAEQGFDRKD